MQKADPEGAAASASLAVADMAVERGASQADIDRDREAQGLVLVANDDYNTFGLEGNPWPGLLDHDRSRGYLSA